MRIKSIVQYSLLIWSLWSYAQPCFTVNTHKGCVPLSITITNCSSNTPIFYNFNYSNAPTSFVTSTSYTYNTPGTYLVVQRVQGNPNTITSTPDTIVVLPKNLPTFSVDLCANLQVRLSITDTNYESFQVDYGDGTSMSLPKGIHTHTYSSSTTRSISVTGVYNSVSCSGPTSTKSITPIVSLTPPDMIDMAVNMQTSSGSVSFRFGGEANSLYKLERKINSGMFAIIDTLTGIDGMNEYTLPAGQNTSSNLLTYRFTAVDMCGNNSSPGLEMHNIILGASASNGQNTLAFLSGGTGSFVSTTISRNFGVIATNPVSPYIDTDISCNLNACYQVVGTYNATSLLTGNSVKTYSWSPCVTSILIATLPSITINSGYVNEKVQVKWDKPVSVSTYTLDITGTNPQTQTITTASTTSFAGKEDQCFRIKYSDNCGNSSLYSSNTCPMKLELSKNDELINLSWTAYSGYESTGLSSYKVEVLNEDGSIRKSSDVSTSLTYSETLDPSFSYFQYRIKAISAGVENMVSYSNTQVVDLTPMLFMPTAFSPNGDGVNDVFAPKGKYLKTVTMTIYNKWGEVIFKSDDGVAGWDGTYHGEPVPLDTYSFYVEAESNSGLPIRQRGIVSVLR